MENVLRSFFLFLSKSKFLTKMAKKYGLRFGASRFVAGETIGEAVRKIKELNEKGLTVTVDYLGEFVDTEKEANTHTNHCLETIEAIGQEKLDAQLSLKLTSLGLDISEETVMNNMERVMKKAKEYGVFITIDMEDHTRCEKTLDIFKRLKEKYNEIGTVLQAYLYRTEKDLNDLSVYAPNLRLVKGAYKEPPEVAFPDKKDVDENYKKIIAQHLENGHYTAVATHDDHIIDFTKRFVQEKGIKKDQFEFQMLYGIRPEKQLALVKEGYRMRVYVPFGTDWYGYFMRRLAERPANVAFVFKGIFKK
ncbi:proline dehydrogenase [Fervidibacillus albus]|uniref:proline dehydrogenase n=1 Tax=Fervidibacillus albus TaxID=2980026 RepID=A0A9E8LUJ0_9BACI|nr:proline dehydrogenase [Fervidibacillus albus]WAA09927.1 proline dehydrogenase [Fervidibacillus albus]